MSAPTTTAPPRPPNRGARRVRHLGTPLVLGAVLAALTGYIIRSDLDSSEARSLNFDYLLARTQEHLVMSLVVTALILVIAVPAGVILTRPRARRFAPPALAVANVGQAVPSFGVLILLYLWLLGSGLDPFWIAVAAFVAYGVLPVLRNTMVGLTQVDPAIVAAARGIGMSWAATLVRVELPLAVPVILAGVRTALVISVGSVAFASFIGAGGLGEVISNGIAGFRPLVTFSGAVLVAVLALAIDWAAGIAEDLLRPRGL